jgi:hypothetical protein
VGLPFHFRTGMARAPVFAFWRPSCAREHSGDPGQGVEHCELRSLDNNDVFAST